MARYHYRSRVRKVFVKVRRGFGRRVKSSFINKRVVKFLPIKWWHLMAVFSVFGILIFVKMKKAGVPTKDIIKSAKPGA